MDLNQLDNTGKMRIVQELVPGKQMCIRDRKNTPFVSGKFRLIGV